MPPELLSELIDEIEKNLKTTQTTDELAKKTGYSLYYFYRLFSSSMGMSLSAYTLNRKLKKALAEIASGETAVEVALAYGFNTYAGFYKAFVKEYGCSPKKYLTIYKNEKIETKKREMNYLHLTKKEIKHYLSHWSIDPTFEITEIPLSNGISTSEKVWKIGEDYYLYHTYDRSGELKNIAIAESLHTHGLPSALPVQTITGQPYIDNNSLIILKKGITGEPLSINEIMGRTNDDQITAYGTSIAKLHKAFLEVETQILCDPSDLFKLLTTWALPKVQQQVKQWSLKIPTDFFKNFLTKLSTLNNKLPIQIIHRDPNFSNILFCEQIVSGFVDFDLVEKNIRLFDPCYCATSILSGFETDNYPHWLPILALILKGYDQENPLTKEEKSAIFYVICGIQMICVAYFGDANHDDPNFKRLAKNNRAMLTFIVDNQKNIEQIFAK
ncbi:helix-turn-helix domain-containing protein [Candidatus Enterococcus mansonii]|uniref:HTH araC/xylS-type domain-containing protein n=1 Tax=Candidatus Enterococcus mansonii TaxID=1834181 RepID=A0A242CHG9_9ENTE|nr:helix-turn-helix domain-containing protein [Enterococcus sp. 4G2_DIV0659]OTO09694.1 hypothetical protein A5880_000374 [Enterococcus sp. 4G2_DIV0659]